MYGISFRYFNSQTLKLLKELGVRRKLQKNLGIRGLTLSLNKDKRTFLWQIFKKKIDIIDLKIKKWKKLPRVPSWPLESHKQEMHETDARFWHMLEPNLECIHICLFSVTSPEGAAQECGHFHSEWDKFQRGPDAQVRHYSWFISWCFSPRSGPGDCVKSSHHGNWAGMSQSSK